MIVDIVSVLHQTMSVRQFFLSSMCTPHDIGGALEHNHSSVALHRSTSVGKLIQTHSNHLCRRQQTSKARPKHIYQYKQRTISQLKTLFYDHT
jgi:hypothetical protein